jgi:anthranilate phosphoribosyltransferase
MPDGGHMDELTTAGTNHVAGFGEMSDLRAEWTAESLGMLACPVEKLQGGTAEENVACLSDIISGRHTGGLVDTLLLNAAAAFQILERVDNLQAGMELARESLLGGAVKDWLDKARAFYAGE